MTIRFDNTYARQLEGFYAACKPEHIAEPSLIYFNNTLAKDLGLNLDKVDKATLAQWFSGSTLPEGAEPIAQVYAGHQFGHFNPQLGDGRAHLLGEIITPQNQRVDITLKGSGRTPYSRGGDGKGAIGPMLREVLIGEAMHALGVPSTRSLALVATNESVVRDTLLPGAIVTRTASSHLRIGTFEFFAARGDKDKLKQLANYSIARHDPELLNNEHPYLEFFDAVVKRQAKLIAQWMGVGFIHGVMNTDNMTISGETIDYGPCAFMDNYKPNTVFSSIDHNGRYAYQSQPRIGHWNLSRLAQSLLLFFNDDQDAAIELAQSALDKYVELYQIEWNTLFCRKLGLTPANSLEDLLKDKPLIEDWLALLEQQKVDFTLAWYYLADGLNGDEEKLRHLFLDQGALDQWLQQWHERLSTDNNTTEQSVSQMHSVNPFIIPRNHHVETALSAASDHADYQPFENLLTALQTPFTENEVTRAYSEGPDAGFTQSYRTFCGT
jgi:uncharacterized protein YdiU (UPF0061 family)